jgi:UDP-GlcNAc3NAcA epimerase
VARPYNEPYYFATIHRPYNTDDPARLQAILDVMNTLPHRVVFPIHPRTVARLQAFGLSTEQYANILFIPPQSYSDSIAHQKFAVCVITDSGGIQKEAYILEKQCVTLRSETEWTETLENGWNTLVFDHLSQLPQVLQQTPGTYRAGIYGEGHAAEEITQIILQHI